MNQIKPKVKVNITIHFMNGDIIDCHSVCDYTINQVTLQLVYEKFHTDYPICNIKSICYQYEDMK